MTIETADRIIGFLEKYNGVYRDMVAFLTEKQAKVMADDLLWLLDSVEDEQALVMKIQSEESARSALFEELGLGEIKAKQLILCLNHLNKTVKLLFVLCNFAIVPFMGTGIKAQKKFENYY